jgi:hypothetical protein
MSIDLLLSALSTPRLDGALCKGKAALFDPPDTNTRPRAQQAAEARALRLCGRCPALAQCQCWLDSLPKRSRPYGVVAAKVRRAR